jgi:hypothetical protein
MQQSHVIEVGGRFAGAAVTHGRQFRFVAVDPRAEELDDSVWPSLAELRRVVGHLLDTGRLPDRSGAETIETKVVASILWL